MRVVTTTGGTAAIQVSPDDILPRRGILQRDLIALITRNYEFNVVPVIPTGMPPQPVLTFQSGRLTQEDGSIPIAHFHVLPDGIAVTAADTDLAELIAGDIISRLDNDLSYRFSDAPKIRLYASALVVEFDPQFLESLTMFSNFSQILNEAARRSDPPYSLRRLAFGQGFPTESLAVPSVLQLVPPEFVIEPRASTASTDRTRYFCGAPVRTAEHVALLERMERSGAAPS